MALHQLLLKQFVAGPGAGQEQPEALEAETWGLEVIVVHGASEVTSPTTELGAPWGKGEGGMEPVPCYATQGESPPAPGWEQARSSGTHRCGPRAANQSRALWGPVPAGPPRSPRGPGACPGCWCWNTGRTGNVMGGVGSGVGGRQLPIGRL